MVKAATIRGGHGTDAQTTAGNKVTQINVPIGLRYKTWGAGVPVNQRMFGVAITSGHSSSNPIAARMS